MNIQPFDLSVINEYKMFYMLKKFKTPIDDIELRFESFENYEVFEDCKLFEMNNNYILIAFNQTDLHMGKHNLVATDGIVTEVINLQNFERIYDHYDLGLENFGKGVFSFAESLPIINEQENWRCAFNVYGPRKYLGPNEEFTPIVDGASELVVYEPILSFNGFGYLLYIHRTNDDDIREKVINNDELPTSGVTLGELLKVLSEWSIVSKAPFNNSQKIATDAEKFLTAFDFDHSLVNYQSDMQIAEYIKGNNNARVRPSGVKDTSNDIKIFIKHNIGYTTLACIVALYPDCWDISEIISSEEDKLKTAVEKAVDRHIPGNTSLGIDDLEDIISHIPDSQFYDIAVKSCRQIFRVLEIKRELLNYLKTNPTPNF